MAKRVYFAFDYQDVKDFRANVVRNHNALTGAQKAGYFDASIWEESKKKGDIALKRMINSELKNTSTTAVLIGSETYARPWVQYEIFKSIEVDNRVIGIHINSINGKDGKAKRLGSNPFSYCGLRISDDGSMATPLVWKNHQWHDFSLLGKFSIKSWPEECWGKEMGLSVWCLIHDWVRDDGVLNFQYWIT